LLWQEARKAGVEGLVGSIPLFSKMDCLLGRKGHKKNKYKGKEKNILFSSAHDLPATKLCTRIPPPGTKVVLLCIGVTLFGIKLLYDFSHT
jgi:hypothetical protein